jgi:hypothetical protein
MGLIFSIREWVVQPYWVNCLSRLRMLRGVFWVLDASKVSATDGILPRILKRCFDGFKRPLTLLFNKCLKN